MIFFLYSCIEFFRLPNFSKNINVDEINLYSDD